MYSFTSWFRTLARRHHVFAPVRRTGNRKRFTSCLPRLETLEGRLTPSTFTVTDTNDDSNPGSLRWAIGKANGTSGSHIAFSIGTGVQTIDVTSPLPVITSPVTIDGSTQPGFTPGNPQIVVNGKMAGAGANGLEITASNTTVKDLVIDVFNGKGVYIHGSSVTGVMLEGNFIGVDATGKLPQGNGSGVDVDSGASGTKVGKTGAGYGNLIAGNLADGLDIQGGSTGALVENNVIGYNAANLSNGVNLAGGTTNNTIGGTVSGSGNVISGNDNNGLQIRDSSTSGNLVEGNLIGTDPTGAKADGNSSTGMEVFLGATANTIGGSGSGAGNVISANVNGVIVSGTGTTGNLFEGNLIGLNASGSAPLGNSETGLDIGSANNTVGGTAAGAGNVISGNGNGGVVLSGRSATGILLEGNLIGTDKGDTTALGNKGQGVTVESSASGDTIGGTRSGAGNVISGNTGGGIAISNYGATSVVIQGNHIGTDATGTRNLGNSGAGVLLSGGPNSNNIGGSAPGAGNTIAFNSGAGVDVDGGTNNLISHNSIFSNSPGIVLNSTNGANNNIASPALTSAKTTGTTITLKGTFQGAANTTYVLEFFIDTGADSSGHYEGQTFLGSFKVTSNSSGQVSFTHKFTASVPAGDFITATATDPTNDTSAFSNGQQVVSAPTGPDFRREAAFLLLLEDGTGKAHHPGPMATGEGGSASMS